MLFHQGCVYVVSKVLGLCVLVSVVFILYHQTEVLCLRVFISVMLRCLPSLVSLLCDLNGSVLICIHQCCCYVVSRRLCCVYVSSLMLYFGVLHIKSFIGVVSIGLQVFISVVWVLGLCAFKTVAGLIWRHTNTDASYTEQQ